MTLTSSMNQRDRCQGLEPLVFIVNSDEATRAWIESIVTSAGLRAIGATRASELTALLTPGAVACAILDVSLQDTSCFELQNELAREGVAIMFLTRERCISSCVRAVKAGAVDFLTVPCDANHLVSVLRHAVQEARSSLNRRVQIRELCSRYERLTAREREVFELVTDGLPNKQVAQRLEISEITVQIHRSRVMRKMSARSFASLVRMADALPFKDPATPNVSMRVP
jgi:RNA polymerase sigma factor (sigma-70 family)